MNNVSQHTTSQQQIEHSEGSNLISAEENPVSFKKPISQTSELKNLDIASETLQSNHTTSCTLNICSGEQPESEASKCFLIQNTKDSANAQNKQTALAMIIQSRGRTRDSRVSKRSEKRSQSSMPYKRSSSARDRDRVLPESKNIQRDNPSVNENDRSLNTGQD